LAGDGSAVAPRGNRDDLFDGQPAAIEFDHTSRWYRETPAALGFIRALMQTLISAVADPQVQPRFHAIVDGRRAFALKASTPV